MVEDLREGWPRTLKVGDKVVVRSHTRTETARLGTIIKVTPTGQMDVAIEGIQVAERFSAKGHSGARGDWYETRLEACTAEVEAAIRDGIKRQRLISVLKDAVYDKLATDQLVRMAAVLREPSLDGARSHSDA